MVIVSKKWTIGSLPTIQLIVCLAILTPVLRANAGNVFMGRYRGQTRRDFIFDQIFNNQFPSDTDSPAPENECPDNPTKKLTIDYFKQPLDHFNSGNTATWQQHYQVNDQFFDSKAASPVIFLNIGGEGPISNKWVCFENYTYMELARTHKARVIQLEHRYFGSNLDLKDLSVESLQYLTTEQALADLYSFIDGHNKQNKWPSPKWVAFGGSYPGTMAGLFRLLYPNATQGAVASSAVLYPKLDLYEYSYKMEQDINNTDFNCYTEVKRAFAELQTSMLSDAGRAILKTQLSLITDLGANKDDIETVQFKIFDAFQGILQYSRDARELKTQTGHKWTLQNLCTIMTKADRTLLERLSDVYTLAHDDDPTFDPSYANMIRPWQSINLKDNDGTRGWLWLSCNEFGWLQSTTNSGLFGEAVPLAYLVKICTDLFDYSYTAIEIEQRVLATLNRYGYPWNFNASNVIFPVGGYDPWSTLAVNVTNTDIHLLSHVTPGAAHCSDMYAQYSGEPDGLEDTRTLVRNEVKYYLSQPSVWGQSSGSTSVPTFSPQSVPTPATSGPKSVTSARVTPPQSSTQKNFSPTTMIPTSLLCFLIAILYTM